MNKLYLFLAFCLFVLPVKGQNSDFNQKLPVDESVRVGRLDNGMTYFIKKFSNPKERGEFFIVHNVGAHQENPDQNGLAHFLEHMAFNGTKNFPGKNMLEYLGSIGVRFGYNVNAYTSRERTVYNISEVPLIRESIIDSVLLALHDWSYYITCDPSEIDKERGVIREEWRLSDNTRSRMVIKSNTFQYRGSKYGETTVIGTKEVIDTFKPATLVDFYHKWYRPDMQALVLVGDFDLDKMEKKIKERFSSIPKAENPAPKVKYNVPDNKEPIYGVVTDHETKATAVKLIFKRHGPTDQERLTVSPIYKSVAANLITTMFKTKLEKIKEGKNSPFKTITAVDIPGMANLNFLQITATPAGDNYLNALKAMLKESARVKKYGFTKEDLAFAKAVITKKESAERSKLINLKNADLVSPIIEHFTNGYALTTIETVKEKEWEILKSITLEQVNAYIPEMITEDNEIILASCPESEASKAPSESEVFKLVEECKNIELAPYEGTVTVKEPVITSKLEGSVIVSEKAWPEYGFKEWKLKNGIKVYWYRNQEPDARFVLTADSKGGLTHVGEERLPSAKILDNAVRDMGVGNLNGKELKLYLVQRDLFLFPSIGLFSESFSGSSSVKESESLLKLIMLYFTSPVFNQGNFDKMVEKQKENFDKRKGSKSSVLRDSTNILRYGENNYTKPLSEEDLKKVSLSEVKSIFNERFSNAADFEFFLMGPQSDQEIKPLVEKYIGSLPVDGKREKYMTKGIALQKGVNDLNVWDNELRTPKCQIGITYHGDVAYNQKNWQTLVLLKYVLSDRYIKYIREEKGGAYHVGVSAELFSGPNKRAEISVNFETDPKLREDLIDIVHREIKDIAENGPAQDEIKDALLFIKKNYKDREKKADYWYGRFRHLVREGFDIYTGEEENIEKISKEDIRKLAKKIVEQGNVMTTIYGTK
jgi:zinc protease